MDDVGLILVVIIVGFLILLILNYYFVYLPSILLRQQLDPLIAQISNLINSFGVNGSPPRNV